MLERLPGRLGLLAPVLGILSPVLLTLVVDVMPKGIAILSGKQMAAYIAPIVRILADRAFAADHGAERDRDAAHPAAGWARSRQDRIRGG